MRRKHHHLRFIKVGGLVVMPSGRIAKVVQMDEDGIRLEYADKESDEVTLTTKNLHFLKPKNEK